jgi:hypothetical protein
MAGGGRFEATVTVPAGGWDIAANGGSGAFTATIPAGDYYLGDLVVEVQTQLNAAAGGTWALSKDWGEAGTGAVGISCTLTFSITWTDPELGVILGHATITNSAVPVLGSHAVGIWIPACPKWSRYDDGEADVHTDLRQTIGPTGGVKTLIGNTFNAVEDLRWEMVRNARAVGLASVESWQGWWRIITGQVYSYFLPGKPVRYYWDADFAGSSDDYQLVLPKDSKLDRPPSVNGWTGLYSISMPMMVEYTAPA